MSESSISPAFFFDDPIFPGRVIISLCDDLPWPACSPELSACDCFLWGYHKAEVYTTRPRTIDDLKIVIRKKISDIPENTARRALGKLRARLGEFARNDGTMGNKLVTWCSKRNKHRHNENYVE